MRCHHQRSLRDQSIGRQDGTLPARSRPTIRTPHCSSAFVATQYPAALPLLSRVSDPPWQASRPRSIERLIPTPSFRQPRRGSCVRVAPRLRLRRRREAASTLTQPPLRIRPGLPVGDRGAEMLMRGALRLPSCTFSEVDQVRQPLPGVVLTLSRSRLPSRRQPGTATRPSSHRGNDRVERPLCGSAVQVHLSSRRTAARGLFCTEIRGRRGLLTAEPVVLWDERLSCVLVDDAQIDRSHRLALRIAGPGLVGSGLRRGDELATSVGVRSRESPRRPVWRNRDRRRTGPGGVSEASSTRERCP